MARNASTLPVASARAVAAQDLRTLTTPYGVIETYSNDPGYVIAVTGPYAIQIILQQGTTATASVLRRALVDLSTRCERIGFVGVLEPDAQLTLGPDVRDAYSALIRRYSPRFSGAALVYEKQGFKATAMRSVVTAINVASRAQHPNRVFSDLREGMSWLSKLTAAEPTPAGLIHIVQMLRQLLRNGP